MATRRVEIIRRWREGLKTLRLAMGRRWLAVSKTLVSRVLIIRPLAADGIIRSVRMIMRGRLPVVIIMPSRISITTEHMGRWAAANTTQTAATAELWPAA